MITTDGNDSIGQAPGALVISLDFELMWGVRDFVTDDSPYIANLRGVREAIPRILDMFGEYEVAATWATVGALFAESLDEFREFIPTQLPSYRDDGLSPYLNFGEVRTGKRELYFAPELVADIASFPLQELASHTYSHFYCLEPGQNLGQFEADMTSAKSIAAAKGYELSSLVFPRNQLNKEYLPALSQLGFTAVRGMNAGRFYRPHATSSETPLHRGFRMVDSIVDLSGPGAFRWSSLMTPDGLVDVRASRFFRPYTRQPILNKLSLDRVSRGMQYAAANAQLYHLWWHPHNFGVSLSDNLSNLRHVLELLKELEDSFGFATYTMRQVAEIAQSSRSASANDSLDFAGRFNET